METTLFALIMGIIALIMLFFWMNSGQTSDKENIERVVRLLESGPKPADEIVKSIEKAGCSDPNELLRKIENDLKYIEQVLPPPWYERDKSNNPCLYQLSVIGKRLLKEHP
jgi:hypothetical protein